MAKEKKCLEIQINEEYSIEGDTRSFILRRKTGVNPKTEEIYYDCFYYFDLESILHRMLDIGIANSKILNAEEILTKLQEIKQDITETIKTEKFSSFIKESYYKRMLTSKQDEAKKEPVKEEPSMMKKRRPRLKKKEFYFEKKKEK